MSIHLLTSLETGCNLVLSAWLAVFFLIISLFGVWGRFYVLFLQGKSVLHFFFYLTIVDTWCYISLRCTTSWFNRSVCYAMLTTSVATICHHTTLLQYHWLYSLCCGFYSHDLIHFHNWKPDTLTLKQKKNYKNNYNKCGSNQDVLQ